MKAPTDLACPNGHQVTVQAWGTRPLCCPACVHGIPCALPLTPIGRRGGLVSTTRKAGAQR